MRLNIEQPPVRDDLPGTAPDFDAVRSRIVDGCLIAGSIAAIPSLGASFYRSDQLGWHSITILHVALAAMMIASTLARKRLPYSVRAGLLVGTVMALGIAGVGVFGLAANGRFFLLGAILIAVLFFGIRTGLVMLLIAIAVLIGTYVSMKAGYIVFDANSDAMLISASAWVTSVTNLTLLSALVGIPLSILLGQLATALTQAKLDRNRLALSHQISEDFFSKAFHSSPLVLVVSNPDTGKIYDVNQACIDLSGYSREDFLNHTSLGLGVWVNPEDRHTLLERLKHDLYVHDMEVTMRTKDGRRLDILLTADLIKTDDGNRMLLVGQDVTRLKDIARMKSEFISIVSHELRTPLTSIYGSLRLILNLSASALPEQPKQLLAIALRNASRLTALVNDLLDLDKLQSGGMKFSWTKVDLGATVRDAIAQCEPMSAEFGVRFVGGQMDASIYVFGDETRLNQVAVNILANAAKFSPRGAEVHITVFARDGFGCVEISDRGPGIPDSFRSQLFDRFTQVDGSNTRKVQGSGLGLNISKSIVDAHHGRIDFRSNHGGGTTFFFEIPLFDETKPTGDAMTATTMDAV